MLRMVPHTVPRVGRSYEHFLDGLELHLLRYGSRDAAGGYEGCLSLVFFMKPMFSYIFEKAYLFLYL